MKPLGLIKREPVLSAAVLLAVVSAFFVRPDREYAGYFDLRTLAILFSLMTVMSGLRRQGLFERAGRALLKKSGSMRRLTLLLCAMCYFGSMLITNDVALITFVPFTFAVLSSLGEEKTEKYALPIVCMQTFAANLGSMLTPVGNPQNLYLYAKSEMSTADFMLLMLPYAALSAVLICVWVFLLCQGRNESITCRSSTEAPLSRRSKRLIAMYSALFALCLLAVIRVLPYQYALAAVFLCAAVLDRGALSGVDYSLLLTFAALFVFIGNLGRLPAFSELLRKTVAGREVPIAILASQVMSNVPAALLLSGFTNDLRSLAVGIDLGGLGTLIASMASLISYRQIATLMPEKKGKYILLFSSASIVFLVFLVCLWLIIG